MTNTSGFNSVEANIPDVKTYVEGNPGSAQAILDAEKARGDNARATLIKHLEDVVASQAPAVTVAADEVGAQNTHSFFGKDYARSPDGGFRLVPAAD